jgi:hypothetical protein
MLKPLSLVLPLFVLAASLWAQQPTKEYIYLGGRVIAIEQSGGNQGVREVVPSQKTYPASGQSGTLWGAFSVNADGPWAVTGVPSWITIVSAASGTGPGTVTYSISPQVTGASRREATLQVGAKGHLVVQLGSGAVGAPSSVSVSPASGEGPVATLEFRSTSPAGGAYIEWIQGLINYGVDGRDACNFIYTARDGKVYIGDGVGPGWNGTGYIGQSGNLLVNEQCSIDLAGATQRVDGNDLVVRLPIRFSPIFAGKYTVYMLTGDSGGGWEAAQSWVAKGSWTPSPPPAAPSVISSSPESGSGRRKTFTYQISSPMGPTFVRAGLILFNSVLDGNSGCYLGFVRTGGVFAINGQYDFPGALGVAGEARTIESPRCRLYLATSSISVVGNSLTVSVDVEFLPAISGMIGNWFIPFDRPNNTPGWVSRGSWNINSGGTGGGLVSHWRGEGNSVDSVGTNHGTVIGAVGYGAGAVQQGFVFGSSSNARVRIGSGATMSSVRTISAWVKFNAFSSRPLPVVTVGGPDGGADFLAISGVGAQCGGQYRFSFDNSGLPTLCGATTLMPGVWYHVAHTFDGATSRLYVNGVLDASAPSRTYTPLLGTMDIGGNTTTGAGAWLIAPQFSGVIDEVRYHNVALTTAEIVSLYANSPPPPTPPVPISVTSTPVVNGSTLFSFTFSGGEQTNGGRVLIGQSDGDGSQSCFLFLDRPTTTASAGTVYLVTDIGSGSTSGPIGGAGLLTNSICEVNRAGTSVAKSGANWTFTVPVRFLPLYRGTQKIFMLGHDVSGNAVGSFVQMGTVTPYPAPAPASATVTPSSGGGSSAKFRYRFNVGADGRFIRYGFALINDVLDGSTACAVSFDALRNTLSMNPFVAPTTQGIAGTSGVLTGPRCSLNLSDSTITASATELIVELNLSFVQSFVGPKNNYAYAMDRSGGTAGWNLVGSWTPQPEVFRLQPFEHSSASVGRPYVFNVDCGGPSPPARLATNVSWSVSPAGFASIALSNQGRTATITPSGTPASGVLLVTATGLCGGTTQLTAQGLINMFYYQNPAGPFVSPFAGLGAGSEFLFWWSIQPTNGGILDSTPVQLLISSSDSTANNSCYLMFAYNTMLLRSDTTNSWVPVQPNGGSPSLPFVRNTTSPYFVENSQCRLSWTNSYTETDSINRRLNLNLSFKPAFVGAKGVFGKTGSMDSATAVGFSRIGSWVVTRWHGFRCFAE